MILCAYSKTSKEIGIEINKGKRTIEGLTVKLEKMFYVKGKIGLALIAVQAKLVRYDDVVMNSKIIPSV